MFLGIQVFTYETSLHLTNTCLAGIHLCVLTSSSARGETFEDDHPHVQALLDPDLVHDADHLQGQHVLPQVVS